MSLGLSRAMMGGMTGVSGAAGAHWSGLLRDVRGVVAGASAVLLTAVAVVAAHGGDPARADTYVVQARSAAVELSDGRVLEAREGLRVPDGASVRTASGGGAVLETGGRSVLVGALSTVRVLDGVTQELQRGQVLVDARGAEGLSLGTRAGQVTLPDGAQARVETGPVLRLGVFAGSARLTLPGRQATTEVSRLHQALVPYAGRPDPATALALTDDAWEQRIVPDLVNADRDLRALARGLAGADASSVLTAAPVALREVPVATDDAGENALAVAVAQASRRGAPVADTLREVQQLRAEGGSWGVVAALVGTRVSSVSAVLDAVLTAPEAPALVAGEQPGLPDLLGGTPDASRSPSAVSSSRSPRPPRPTTSRTPTSGPTTPAPGPLEQLVTTVTGLLSPPPLPVAATPRPSAAAPGLLGVPLLK